MLWALVWPASPLHGYSLCAWLINLPLVAPEHPSDMDLFLQIW